jgi:hypothetical protein
MQRGQRHLAASARGATIRVIAVAGATCCADVVSIIGPVLLLLAFLAVAGVAWYLNEPQRRARRRNSGESAEPEQTGLGNGLFFN